MFQWLPDVCRELRGELLGLYWILIIPLVTINVLIELLRDPKEGAAARIIKRAVISMILIWTFDDCLNLIAEVADGISGKINGLAKLMDLLKDMGQKYQNEEVSLLAVREALIFMLNFFSYVVAYFGFFIAQAIIHFVWAVLYVASPLMILMYVSERTAFITSNLYKGLLNVASWKIMWSIMGVMLLKLAKAPQTGGFDNFLTTAIVNFCIGLCMLMVPYATKSLLNDGMSSAGSMMAGAAAGFIGKTVYGRVVSGAARTGKAVAGLGVNATKATGRLAINRLTSRRPKVDENHDHEPKLS